MESLWDYKRNPSEIPKGIIQEFRAESFWNFKENHSEIATEILLESLDSEDNPSRILS